MDYEIGYTIPCGKFTMLAYAYEVAGILRNMVHMALQGHQFSNVTITRV
jgi:hypothetical protein